MPVLRWKEYCVRSLPDDKSFIARHLLVARSWFDLTKQQWMADDRSDTLKIVPEPFFKQDDNRRNDVKRHGQQRFSKRSTRVPADSRLFTRLCDHFLFIECE